jgi:hypothetical protein
VQFSASGLGVGAGCHVMAPDQLAGSGRRSTPTTSGEALVAAVAAVRADGVSVPRASS